MCSKAAESFRNRSTKNRLGARHQRSTGDMDELVESSLRKAFNLDLKPRTKLQGKRQLLFRRASSNGRASPAIAIEPERDF